MDWVQTPSWFSAPCSKHVFLETGVRGTVWPYRKEGMKWEVAWVRLLEGFTGLPAIHEWKGKKLLIRSISPLCHLSKRRQESSGGFEVVCISISLLPFGLSTNTHRGLWFLWILLSPMALPERCPATGQGRGQRRKLGLEPLSPAMGRCWAAPQRGTPVLGGLCPPAPLSLSPAEWKPGGRGSSSHGHRGRMVVSVRL